MRRQHSFEDIVSKNNRMLKIFSLLPQVAESGSTVLIEGASGTGKELIARAIHNHSPHRGGAFIAVNCGALPDTLIEAELFGYKAGAFTDARKDKPGRFALAQNGTVFLDEIGDITPAVQVRLLRVLQQKVYEPLGSGQSVPTNARVIAATHRRLEDLVKAEKFRDDLYFRINVFKIILPPLSERREDIPLLVDHFIERFNHQKGRGVTGISREAISAIMLHDWPGNVRELENAIEHAFVLCRDDLIRLEDLPEHLIPQRRSRQHAGRRDLAGCRKIGHPPGPAAQPGQKGRGGPRARHRQEHPAPQDDPPGHPADGRMPVATGSPDRLLPVTPVNARTELRNPMKGGATSYLQMG